ncbi:MAG: hypothetical protein GY714_32425 [Desulfobacterales bacterium]|nr:hypothetical protein [Desulfobacterales bacterium]
METIKSFKDREDFLPRQILEYPKGFIIKRFFKQGSQIEQRRLHCYWEFTKQENHHVKFTNKIPSKIYKKDCFLSLDMKPKLIKPIPYKNLMTALKDGNIANLKEELYEFKGEGWSTIYPRRFTLTNMPSLITNPLEYIQIALSIYDPKNPQDMRWFANPPAVSFHS